MKNILKKLRLFSSRILKKQTVLRQKIIFYIDRKPFTSFLITLGLLMLLIVIGSLLRRPSQVQVSGEMSPKVVQVYKIGNTPEITIQGKVEKTGVIKIIAQVHGIASYINVSEGQEVSEGDILLGMSSNYRGGNSASVSRQIANTQYQNVLETYNTQKDLIVKQREVTNKNQENTEALNIIAKESLKDTDSLIKLNDEILNILRSNLSTLESTNTGGMNNSLILSVKQGISQFASVVNQLQSGVRAIQYQSNSSNPPLALASLQKEIAIKQLDLQEKALKVTLETARLQLQLAQINESTMFPSAPFTGVVERVNVVPGQLVNPGDPLLVLHGSQTVKIVAVVPPEVAVNVSRIEPSTLFIGTHKYTSIPTYISQDVTDGQLSAITFAVPDEYQTVPNGSFVKIILPIGFSTKSSPISFVPLDVIYQSQNDSYVFVAEKGVARSKKVILGGVQGQYVKVISGLNGTEEIILNRNVINGEKIKTQAIL